MLAQRLDLADRLDEVIGHAESGPWVEVARLVAAGEHAEAARRLDEAGDLTLAAEVRVSSQTDAELEKAIDFFGSVGATRYLTRAESKLAAMA